ncbi:MAG TPA: ring-cleaving dioxygenase [Spirochaetia bacterium]
MALLGIHHVTSLASDPQRNVDFYTGLLGLRLVKRTVNFDAPDVYHFYYGDETGTPGTLLTFFPFPDAARGKRGAGETTAVAFSVPSGSLATWGERLAREGVALLTGPSTRFGQSLLSFEDPDGMVVELVADPAVDAVPGWAGSPAGAAHAIRRFHGVTFTQTELERPGRFLTGVLGFSEDGVEGSRHRYGIGSPGSAAHIDIVVANGAGHGRQSAGSVHHIAWRVTDDAEQLRWRGDLQKAGVSPTPVMDRSYFHSIYFREPGGVLFEIATDPPGFAIDEPVTTLGEALKLPPWLEEHRPKIERHLPPISVATASQGAA